MTIEAQASPSHARGSEWLRVREAAQLLGVSPNTLRRAENAGVVSCLRSPGGHRRYRRRDLEKVLADGGLRRQNGRGATPAAPAAQQTRDTTGELARQIANLSARVELAQEINSLLVAGPSRLLGAIARRLAQLSGCPICTIYALEGDHLRVLVSFEDDAFDEAWAGRLCEPSFWPPAVEALRRQEPWVIVDSSDPAVPAATRAVMKEWACSATLTIPLIIEGATIGLVELSDHAPHDFGDELQPACDLAQTAAHAIQNARLLQQVEHTNAVLAALVELGAFIAQTHDLETVARAVTERLRNVVDVAYSEIYLIEEGRLRLLGGHDEAPYEEHWLGWNDDLARYPTCAAAMAAGEILVVTSADDVRLTEFERERFREYGLVSEITVPLIVGEHVVGIIDLFDVRERDYADYVDFLRSIGQLVAGHMQNALLFTEAEHHNAMLRELVEIGALASRSRDVGALVRTLAERLMVTVDANLCEIYALEDGRLRLLAGHDRVGFGDEWNGWTDEIAHYPTTAAAVEALDVLVVEDLDDSRLSDFERGRMADLGLVSEVCVPLVVEDRAVGTIDVFDTKARDYHESLGFLRSVAPVLAGAIDGALLVDRLRASTRDLQMLVDSSLDFGSSLELDDVLATIAARMATVSGARSCDIYAIDGDDLRGLLSYEPEHLLEGFAGSIFPWRELTFCRKAVETGEPAASFDVLTDPEASPRDIESAKLWDYRAELDLPLIASGRLVGMATVFAAEPRAFAQVKLLRGLAAMAAQAVTNASLYRELDQSAQRMSLVAGASMELSASLDLDSVLNNVARSLSAVSGFVDCDVYKVHEDGVECVVSLGDGTVCREWLGQTRSFQDWPTMGRAAAGGKPIGVSSPFDPDLAEAERREMIEWGEKATLIVPLLAKEQAVAIVELSDTTHERTFAAEELATVEAISRVGGMAIDNAMLYEDIKQMHVSNLKALSSALNAKDYYTLGHAARVAAYMVLLGKELGWPAEVVHGVEEAAYLHDIGKIGVSDRILLKPGGLNAREWELMRQHPVFSADIIKPLFSPDLVLGVRHHHERYDGEGYPDGLAGEAIPEIARAMCVVDSYDAMSFHRPYRQALSASECRAELLRCRGQQFDPRMSDAFLRVLDRLQERKAAAEAVAEQAAARIDAEKHALLRTREDEERPEYEQLRGILREVRDANPPTRYLTSRAMVDDKHIIVVDPEEDPEHCSLVGDEVFADEELPAAFSGLRSNTNVLFVDEFGVWMTGLAPVRNARGEIVAVVAADMPPPETLEEEMEGLRSDVTQTFASMLKSAASRLSRAELDAITDGLTGLYNHRYLHERLSEEVERAREQGAQLALLFCDLDNFKAFNDSYGHSVGDGALRAVARAIEGCLRHVDMAARYGGEEFAIVLVETDREGAVEVAERIRKAIAAIDLDIVGAKLSVSIGVGVFPEDAGGKSELLDKADWAMYLAKRRGRDQVTAFADGQLRLPFV